MSQTMLDPTAGKQPRTTTSPIRRELVRNEFLDGSIVPKQAADRWHNIIATNFIVAIGSRVHRGTSEVYGGDMPVRLGVNSICFPDVVVVSGEPEFTDASSELLLNPTVVIEISSTMAKFGGRSQKLEGFLAIPKIKECLLVNESEMRIEHYARQNAKQWIYRIYDERDDVITLESINCKLSLTEVYAQVKVKDSGLTSKAAG